MIFVDTSAIFALADELDIHHQDAKRLFDALLRTERRRVTHSYVLIESMAIAPALPRTQESDGIRDRHGGVRVEWVGERLHGAAVQALHGQPSDISLVDQVSFLVMRQRGIEEAFAFDSDFTAAGFRLNDA